MKMFYYEDDSGVPTVDDEQDELNLNKRILVDVTLAIDIPDNQEPFEAANFWIQQHFSKLPKSLVEWDITYAQDEIPAY